MVLLILYLSQAESSGMGRRVNKSRQVPLKWDFRSPHPIIPWHVDRTVLIVTYTLALIGLMMVFSASGVKAESQYGDSTYLVKRQAAWLLIGLVVLHGVSYLDYRIWKTFAPHFFILTLVLLACVLIPFIGHEVNGARRWFRIGGFSVQPGELAKLAVVFYLASYLTRNHDRIKVFCSGIFAPILAVGILAGFVLAEPDMGTAVVLMLLLIGFLFLGGIRLTHLFGFVLALLPVLFALATGSTYRRKRMLSFLDPWQDPTNTGFQLTQSFVALGNGGIFGVGLGDGKQKLFFLPEAHSDFVLALIGEELGLLGTGTLLLLFAVLVWKGFQIAGQASEPFGQYLACGVTMLLGLQALINAGVVCGLFPTKGLTLPLVSYGGSSLLVTLLAIGILLSVSRAGVPKRSSHGYLVG